MQIQYNLNQVEAVAQKILEFSKSKIILFEGEMGVGKTTLIKTIVRLLGSEDIVSSPTFSLVNQYITDDASIYHFDLYRIEDEVELYNFGIETYIYSNHYVVVEWPSLLKPLIQEPFTSVTISLTENHYRSLFIENIE